MGHQKSQHNWLYKPGSKIHILTSHHFAFHVSGCAVMMLQTAPTAAAVAAVDASISYSEVLLEHHESIRLMHATS
jgi:hypothetical protein